MKQGTWSANVQNVSVLYLVRHGQASFGTEDYDRLSPRGKDQSQSLGNFLMRAGTTPTSITSGDMKRQRQTAQGLIEAADWDTTLDIDPGWDEFNASDLISAYPTDDPSAKSDSRAFQRLLEKASTRWASGDHDADYLETFTAFTDRVDAALDRAVDGLGSGQSAVVVSSSGVIAWAAARLLDGGFQQWLALNRVTVNSGVTKIVSGASGKTMVTFNDHGHLPSSWITYR
ncbi:histidine phosphatase family protein [Paeniglutamicibacter kerguelensis]